MIEDYQKFLRCWDFIARLVMIAKGYKSCDEFTHEDIVMINNTMEMPQ